MTPSEKIKTINNKIEQNKAQYSLDRQTAKISVLSSGNVAKYEYFTGEDVLPGRGLMVSWKSRLTLQTNKIKCYTKYTNLMEQ